LVNEITTYTSSLQLGKDVKVNIEIDPQSSNFYRGDEYRLRQILINLVGNAIKYTEVGSVTLKVNVVTSENSKDTLQFIVQDTGVGMSTEALEKAFSEFEQFSEIRTSNEMGTGLGLAITQKIVELFNGSIYINSEIGKGTTVQVEIELERTFRPENKPTEVNNIPCSSVLIVDDEVYNRKLVNAMLSSFLLEINEVENGKDALDILMSKPIDLVLLDAKMPVMDGLETIRAIRNLEDKQKSKVKVILLTAADSEISDIIDKVDGFLPKPFNEEQLIDEIVLIFDTDKKEKIQMINIVVDFSNLKSLSGSDKNFYNDMLQTFVISTTNSHQVIKAAFSKNDWELLANESHKIASPCRHIGANNMHKILKDIEQSARSNQQTLHLKESIKILNKEVELVIDSIQTEISTLSLN
jgi:CheY-like chemotaxis protein